MATHVAALRLTTLVSFATGANIMDPPGRVDVENGSSQYGWLTDPGTPTGGRPHIVLTGSPPFQSQIIRAGAGGVAAGVVTTFNVTTSAGDPWIVNLAVAFSCYRPAAAAVRLEALDPDGSVLGSALSAADLDRAYIYMPVPEPPAEPFWMALRGAREVL